MQYEQYKQTADEGIKNIIETNIDLEIKNESVVKE